MAIMGAYLHMPSNHGKFKIWAVPITVLLSEEELRTNDDFRLLAFQMTS